MIEKAPDASNQSGLLAVNRASYDMRSELQAVEFRDFLAVVFRLEAAGKLSSSVRMDAAAQRARA